MTAIPVSRLKPPRLHLTRSQLAAIGLFNARWAYFEFEMDFIISLLRELQKEPKPAPGGFLDRLKYWKRLVRKQFANEPKILAAYLKIIGQLKDGNDRRTTIIHARALGDPKGRAKAIAFDHHQHKPSGWNSRLWKFTPRQIIAMATYLGRLATWLYLTNLAAFGAPVSLPRRYPRSPAAYTRQFLLSASSGSPRLIRLKSSEE